MRTKSMTMTRRSEKTCKGCIYLFFAPFDDRSLMYYASASSTASLTSSILEYRKFQGRTFNSDKYETEYFAPNDERQKESIDIS